MSRCKQIALIGLTILINGCQVQQATLSQAYQPKQERLHEVVQYCEQCGWNYATTNRVCVTASQQGVYGVDAISDDQLMRCGRVMRVKSRHGFHLHYKKHYRYHNYKGEA